MRKISGLFLALSLLMLSLAPSVSGQSEIETRSLDEMLRAETSFSELVALLEAADLMDALAGEGPLTLFAPSNQAFALLDPALLAELSVNSELRETVLSYHIVPALISSLTLDDLADNPTLQGGTIEAELLFIRKGDYVAANGVLHVLDAFLLPPLPQADEAVEAESDESEAEATEDILTLVANNPDLAFLQTALDLSPIVSQALSGEGPFTLFAPSAEAFSALDASVRNRFVRDTDNLTSLLFYHLVGEQLSSVNLVERLEATTSGVLRLETGLPGGFLSLQFDDDGALVINGARFSVTDIEASNGVIHIIDRVIIPQDSLLMTFAPLPAGEASAPEIEIESNAEFPEGPALAEEWFGFIGGEGGFGMAELDTADDFFVTVVDPFTQNELYGIEIINWVADYRHTGFVITEYLTAEVLIWMNEQDPNTFENIADSVLRLLAPEELAQLPEELQARVSE